MPNVPLLCRFCAQEQPLQNIINLKMDKVYRLNIKFMLTIFSDEIVNFTNDYLPETVCTTCYNILCKSYEFFRQVRSAQVILGKLFNVKNASNMSLVKEECYVYEYDGNETDTKPDFKTFDVQESSIAWSAYPWSCASCSTTLPSLETVREHNQNHHKTCYGFQCADCGEKFDRFDEFVEHVLKEREELKKYCVYCNMVMENSAHSETHKTDNKCMYCGQIFTNKFTLVEHLKKYATDTEQILKLEMEIWKDDSPFKSISIQSWSQYPHICVFCNIKVAGLDTLKAHCLLTHKRCFGMKCIDCDADDELSTFDEFVQHVGRHRPNLKNICHYCDSMDIEGGHIKSHVGRYQCKICCQNFRRIRDLRRHDDKLETPVLKPPRKRRIGPITDEDIVCNICGKRMQTPISLRAHKLVHTERKRNHTCDRCGKAFYTKGSLEGHSKTHDGVMQETCRICNKSFLTVHRLKKHVATHNLKMTFQCDICKKFFSSKDSLRTHVYVHLNIKPYQCEYCLKCFRYKHIMKTHENQHTGARPYSCDVCFINFTCWSNCDKHMRRIHGKSLAKAVMTPYGKLPINPDTGKPSEVNLTSGIKEWSRNILEKRRKNKSNIKDPKVNS